MTLSIKLWDQYAVCGLCLIVLTLSRYRMTLSETLTQADAVPQACLSLRQPLSIDQPDLSNSTLSPPGPRLPRGGSGSAPLCGGASYAEGPDPGVPGQAN